VFFGTHYYRNNKLCKTNAPVLKEAAAHVIELQANSFSQVSSVEQLFFQQLFYVQADGPVPAVIEIGFDHMHKDTDFRSLTTSLSHQVADILAKYNALVSVMFKVTR
jgi:hypothetical protein